LTIENFGQCFSLPDHLRTKDLMDAVARIMGQNILELVSGNMLKTVATQNPVALNEIFLDWIEKFHKF
jgi:hypothetical protein